MKTLVAIAVLSIAVSVSAETLTFPAYSIELGDGWNHRVENTPQSDNERGPQIAIYATNGVGTLKMQSLIVPTSVDRERLRNMTNVDSSVPLAWQKWGDYSGYSYEYLERGLFYRQWWITHEQTIVVITYDCDAEARDVEINEITGIVRSIRVNSSH